MTATLLPEWTPCEAVILAWPNENTDWAPWLSDVVNTYTDLVKAINAAGAGVILLCREQDKPAIRETLAGAHVLLLDARYNDTWVRDYAFLTVAEGNKRVPVEFQFNGWGNKFNAQRDNEVNQRYLSALCKHQIKTSSVVCEGGALEIDQNGHLLSTLLCLSNPERNGAMTSSQYSTEFARILGSSQTTILRHGHLEGDDTDGHIDTLVRYTPDSGLVIQSCHNRPDDGHYEGLSNLVDECKQAFPSHDVFELPLPAIFNEDNDRLPASYANYLICNDSVLCPVYGQAEDEQAISAIQQAYPAFTVVPVNCYPLVQQYGSLHCITMQVPVDTLKPEIQHQLTQGVTEYVS